MQVTIFGATGKVGRQLVRQALAKGYTVKAFGRDTSSLIDEDLRNEQFIAVKGYVFEENDIQQAIEGSSVILSALGGASDGSDKTRSLGMKTIIAAARKSSLHPRIINVGNMGILPATAGDGLIMDAEDFPAEYIPVSQEHYKAYVALKESGLSFLTVAATDLYEGEANGNYNVWTTPPAATLKVSTGNIAAYMLKMAAANDLPNGRIGISDTAPSL